MRNIKQAWRVLWGLPRYRLRVVYRSGSSSLVLCSDYMGYSTNGVMKYVAFMNVHHRHDPFLWYDTHDRLSELREAEKVVEVIEL